MLGISCSDPPVSQRDWSPVKILDNPARADYPPTAQHRRRAGCRFVVASRQTGERRRRRVSIGPSPENPTQSPADFCTNPCISWSGAGDAVPW